ncbi:MAG TPA: SRPBCC family protein [Chloroflexia bacterium]|nr:SRPBCC family protein [Chloroflexia bacterium]
MDPTALLDDYRFEPDLAHAATLPARWYVAPEYLALEKVRIFGRTWQAVGRLDEVTRPGDFFTAEIVGEPLVITRGTDGVLRGFYNVCRHRAGNVAAGKGNRKSLQCRYHGWTYALDGRLMTTPEFDGVADFDKSCFGLQPVRVETWGPFVFANLDATAPTLDEALGAILPETAHIPLAAMRPVERRDYVIDCNWKVYVDNYLEGYHLPIAHPGLYRELDYENYRVETHRYHSRQLAPLRPATGSAGRRYTTVEPDSEVLYYWVFPNFMVNIYPDNMSSNLIIPLGHDKTLTIFEWFFHEQGGGEAWEGVQQAVAFSDEIQQEDIVICEAVQRGLHSRTYSQGRFSVKRENGVHHFHGLVDSFLRDAGPGTP